MSRNFSDSTEWKLNESILTNMCASLFYPDVDLFASRLNKQLDKYVSWFPGPKAVTSDVFSICWSNYKPYVFPPFSLIGGILQQLEDDKVRKAIIIIPMLVTQVWFPKLLQMLFQNPFRLTVTQKLPRLVHNNQYHPLSKRKMFLFACVVSNTNSKTKVHQDSLYSTSNNLGEYLQTEKMNVYGVHGIFGVVKGRLILCNQLK